MPTGGEEEGVMYGAASAPPLSLEMRPLVSDAPGRCSAFVLVFRVQEVKRRQLEFLKT